MELLGFWCLWVFLVPERNLCMICGLLRRDSVGLCLQQQWAETALSVSKVAQYNHDFKPEIILDYIIKQRVLWIRWINLCLSTGVCGRVDGGHQPCSSTSSILQVTMPSVLDHEPNYNMGKSRRRRLFLVQLAEDMMKPLIDGRARNPVGIQVPILAAIRMFVPVEHRIARHIRPQENKTIGRCFVCARKSRSKCDSCNNFICREHSEKKYSLWRLLCGSSVIDWRNVKTKEENMNKRGNAKAVINCTRTVNWNSNYWYCYVLLTTKTNDFVLLMLLNIHVCFITCDTN